jgi:hypothetical protein
MCLLHSRCANQPCKVAADRLLLVWVDAENMVSSREWSVGRLAAGASVESLPTLTVCLVEPVVPSEGLAAPTRQAAK